MISPASGRACRPASMSAKDVAPVRPGKEREGEKETQGPEARHDEVDVAGAQVLRLLVMRHDERPGGERHELPGEEEGEGVVGEDDEVHPGEERREERQDAHRRRFVLAMAERIEAHRGAAEIDDGEERSRERIEAEVAPIQGRPSGSASLSGAACICASIAPSATSDTARQAP